MSNPDAAVFSACRAEAETMLARGEPFEAVEEMLESVPLSDNDRDALWVFAWSMRDRVAPRRPRGLRLVSSQ
jgi:hypothetical protein